jgi:hypothetical protein
MRTDIAPGRTFPDYELSDHTKTRRSLSELAGRRPADPRARACKPRLVIHSVYNGYWFWGRPSIDELWRDLREATREIRPDWDLSASGLREAWDAGDRSRFYLDEDLDPSLRAA